MLPKYTFNKAKSKPVHKLIDDCISLAQKTIGKSGFQEYLDYPCVPKIGATTQEISVLENEIGIKLPGEMVDFYKKCRYLKLDDGIEIGGFNWENIGVTDRPWVSDKHIPGQNVIVVGKLYRYADGDQLLLNPDDNKILLYLHEENGAIEEFAPSFCLALWRILHEEEKDVGYPEIIDVLSKKFKKMKMSERDVRISTAKTVGRMSYSNKDGLEYAVNVLEDEDRVLALSKKEKMILMEFRSDLSRLSLLA